MYSHETLADTQFTWKVYAPNLTAPSTECKRKGSGTRVLLELEKKEETDSSDLLYAKNFPAL